MTDLKILEIKISELEERIKKIEDKINSPADRRNKEWMDKLYEKARELVIKHNRASTIFLQRKLLIDYERAVNLLKMLQKEGVVGPDLGVEPRKILMKK